MITPSRIRNALTAALLTLCAAALPPSHAWAQNAKSAPQTILTVEQPDAQRAKEEFSALLEHYPPSLRGVLALDPSLLGNQSYLAPYPALVGFLSTHPEIPRDPVFYLGEGVLPRSHQDPASQVLDMWRDML